MKRPKRIIVFAIACSLVMTTLIAFLFEPRPSNWSFTGEVSVFSGVSLSMTQSEPGKPTRILWRNVAIVFNLHFVVFSSLFYMVLPEDDLPAAPHAKCVACGYDLYGCEAINCPECGAVNPPRPPPPDVTLPS